MGRDGVKPSTVLVIIFTSTFLAYSSCLEICSASTSKHCETLLQFCVSPKKDSITALISGKNTLNTTCIFNGTKNLTLKGRSATIECSSHQNSGFIFHDVSTLKISDIVFIGCGARENTTNKPVLDGLYQEVLAALLFDGGLDLTLTNITVLNATSAGIYIYNVAEKIIVNSCQIKNAVSDSVKTLSGNIVAFDHHITSNTTLTISTTTFTNNGYNNIYKGQCKKCGKFLYSSGLALFLGSPRVTAEIKNNTFFRNIGCNGGNMAVLFFNHSNLTISNTCFINGTARYGGGLYVSFENSFLDRTSIADYTNFSKVLSIIYSSFVDNYAKYAGGGVYMQWKQSLKLRSSSGMEVTNSTFEGNSLGTTGSGGLAFHYKTYLDTSDDPYSFPLFHVTLNLTNCKFFYHYPNISSSQLQSESSVVVAVNVPYLGIRGITVESNKCTGILAIASTLVFYNSTKLQNNTALTGGGIRLCSSSTMYLAPYTSLMITNNSVQQTGGGIHVYSNCLISKPACFYQYGKNFTQENSSLLSTVNFIVEDNHASKGGDNIYGGLLDNCYFLYVKKEDTQFQHHITVPNNTIDQPSSISSDPQHVCFNYSQNRIDNFTCNRTANVKIYPGQQITIPVRVVGQSFGTVSGAVVVSYSNGAVTANNETAQTVRIPGENITYTVYSSQQDNFTERPARISLTAGLHSATSVHEYSEKYLPAEIYVHFKPCPFGFSTNNSQSSKYYNCTCNNLSKFKVTCSIQHQSISKTVSTAWLGVLNLSNQSYFAYHKHCPFDYCNSSIKSIKSNPYNWSQDVQCQYNRTGILCGSCPEGWSLVLGSSQCHKNCSSYWLFLVLPFALAGLLLIAAIHFLNLTVTGGTICGLVFYANVIQTFSATLFSHNVPGLTLILKIFLSWLNLDFGIQVCFYSGMDAFGKAMLSFVFPVYIWLISIIIVILSNKFIFFTRLFGENSLKVLATLFLLSFSKMLRVINNILNVKLLTVLVSSNKTIHKARWILDGNVSYTDYKHLILVCLAVLTALLAVPFLMSLLCIRHVFYLSRCKTLFMWLSRLKPFFDTYTGPYKDNATFWTGLLLFVRLLLLIIVIYVGPEKAYVATITICLILATSIILLQGVYKKHLNNVLEAFFIMNIGIIFTSQVGKKGKMQWIVPYAMITLAFLAFLGIIAYHMYLKYANSKLASKTPFMHRQLSFDVASVEGMRGYDERDESTEEENIVDASDRLVHFPPVETLNYDYERSNSSWRKS